MLRNQNPRGSTCSGIQTKIPLWGVNIRRNVSRIKRLKALSPSEITPELGGQYAPDYPINSFFFHDTIINVAKICNILKLLFSTPFLKIL